MKWLCLIFVVCLAQNLTQAERDRFAEMVLLPVLLLPPFLWSLVWHSLTSATLPP